MPRKGPDLRKSRHNPNVPDLQGPPAETLTTPGQHSFVRPIGSDPNPIPPPVSLDARGKIGQTVYQLTIGWKTHYEHRPVKELQRRHHVVPFDPQTFLQLLHRSRFAAAVRTWHLLTEPKKTEYNRKGNARRDRIEGLNVWIRQFIHEHDLHEFEADAILRQAQLTIPLPITQLVALTPLPTIDTMRTIYDLGPNALQSNISMFGVYVNDIEITAPAGVQAALLLAQVIFSGGALNERVTLTFHKNGVLIPGQSPANQQVAVANHLTQVIGIGTDPTPAPGNKYKIKVSASASTADIGIGAAGLILVTN